MTKPIAVLLDCNNTLYRMFHTQPARVFNTHRTESAQLTLNSANKFLEGKGGLPKAEVVVAVFDHNGKNFRHELSDAYKSERKGMPEDLKPQEQIAIDAMKAQGIPTIIKPDFEADDSLGMLANHYFNLGYQVYIVTTDKDMHQLVKDGIAIFNPQSKKIMDTEATIAKFGVEPEYIIDLLAIQGDKSDGIAGIDGVGEKTAAKWINAYGTVLDIMDNAQAIKGKGANALREQMSILPLNADLTTIRECPTLLTESEVNELTTASYDSALSESLTKQYGLKFVAPKVKASKQPKASIKQEKKPAEDIQQSLF